MLMEAVELPLEYDEAGRDGALVNLLLHELARATHLPAYPLPGPSPAALCLAFLQRPDVHQSPVQWAQQSLSLSLRTFSRHFRQQTGLSFVQWRQRSRQCGIGLGAVGQQ